MAQSTPLHVPRFPPPPNSLAALFARLTRDQVGEIAEAAIYCLDLDDGDCDVEDGDEDCCPAHDDNPTESHVQRGADYGAGDPDDAEDDDPAGDPLDQGEADEAPYLPKPKYGLDQSTGPINEREEQTAYLAKLQGLERGPAGGWRRRAT